jgi:uncharacterized cupin superfamily protein
MMRDHRIVARGNIFDTAFEYDSGDPAGYRSGMVRVGRAAGGEALGVKLYELPLGQALCPYHYEYEEEWLVVLEGAVGVRRPRGEDAARVLMFSSARESSVAVYPDSDKIGVWTGNDADHVMLRRADGDVDYWDGER